jgi:hypothetical protein
MDEYVDAIKSAKQDQARASRSMKIKIPDMESCMEIHQIVMVFAYLSCYKVSGAIN